MALLASTDSERPITLAASSLVGRSPACSLRLSDRRISSEHARITWRDGRWELRDLGSRNGTFVNGRELEAGGTVALAAGDTIAFGHVSVAFSLLDASPPVALARRLDTGQIVLAEDGLLALPHGGTPEACVVEDRGGSWNLEHSAEARAVQDGEVLTVQGVAYMLHLPMDAEPTLEERGGKPRVKDVELSFRVSQDEERVEVLVKLPAGAKLLPPRAHYYTLLVLARARLRDQGDAALPELARGWVAVVELCRMLAVDEDRLNVDIYRIRRDLGALGLHNPAAVIERQRGQLRLGTSRIDVTRLG